MIPTRPIRKRPRWCGYIGFVNNILPDTKSLPEDAGKAGLPQGAVLGLNDFKKTAYGGPCPPIGRHRYFHKLYALDITLDLKRRDEIADRASNAGPRNGQCRTHRDVSKG